jgi:hypothetical protein
MDNSYKQKVLGRTNRLLSLIRHGPHWKQPLQQFFSCCVCIHYLSNASTEPLPSNDRGIFTEPLPTNDKGIFTETLLSNDRGYTYRHTDWWEIFFYLGRWDGLSCLDVRIKFHKDLFWHSNVNKGDTQTNTHTQTATWSHKPILFLQNKERRLKHGTRGETIKRASLCHFGLYCKIWSVKYMSV